MNKGDYMAIYWTKKKCPCCGGKVYVETGEEGEKIYHCEECNWSRLNTIAVLKENLEILRKAKKECDCEAVDKLHYHELVWEWDGESGNEYVAESEQEHQSFIKWLEQELQKMQRRRRKPVK